MKLYDIIKRSGFDSGSVMDESTNASFLLEFVSDEDVKDNGTNYDIFLNWFEHNIEATKYYKSDIIKISLVDFIEDNKKLLFKFKVIDLPKNINEPVDSSLIFKIITELSNMCNGCYPDQLYAQFIKLTKE